MNQTAFLVLLNAIRNKTITIDKAERLVRMNATEQQVNIYTQGDPRNPIREYGPDTSGIVER